METNGCNSNLLDPLMTLRDVAKPVRGRPARLFTSDVQRYLNGLREERDKKQTPEIE